MVHLRATSGQDGSSPLDVEALIRTPSIVKEAESNDVLALLSGNHSWDALDIQLEVANHWSEYVAAGGTTSVTGSFYRGVYNDYPRRHPPLLILGDGSCRSANWLPQSLSELWLPIMGLWFGLDDLAYGDGTMRLTPFDGSVAVKGAPWYREACDLTSSLFGRATGLSIRFD